MKIHQAMKNEPRCCLHGRGFLYAFRRNHDIRPVLKYRYGMILNREGREFTCFYREHRGTVFPDIFESYGQ